MTLIDKWDGFDAMVDAADAAAFDVDCLTVWPTVTLDAADPVLADADWLAIAHDEPTDHIEQVDYLPANLPA